MGALFHQAHLSMTLIASASSTLACNSFASSHALMEDYPSEFQSNPLASTATLAIPEEGYVVDVWGSMSVIAIITAWGMGRPGAPM